MKTFNQFMTEAYSAQDELNEVVGAVARGASRFIPGLQTAYGLYRGTSALMKGDKTGAALGYGSALPGPLGWGFAAADMGRELARGNKQPQAQKPTKTEPTKTDTAPAKPSMVLAKKDGVEGKLDKATGKFTASNFSDAEKQRYQTTRGAEQIKKDAEKVKSSQPKDYVGQKVKPLELKKPVTLTPMKPAKITIPKISA
jgi:hypothetical protein